MKKAVLVVVVLALAAVSQAQTCPVAGDRLQSGSITLNGGGGPSGMMSYDPSNGVLYADTGTLGTCDMLVTKVYATVINLSKSQETATLSVWDCSPAGCSCSTWPLAGVAALLSATQIVVPPNAVGRTKLIGVSYLSTDICVTLSGLPSGADRGGNLWNASIQIPNLEVVAE